MVYKPSLSVFLAKGRKDVVSAGGWSLPKLRWWATWGLVRGTRRDQEQKLGNKIH